jgi:phosphoserine aminotransferase
MRKKNFFTLHPSLPYFTFPFHLVQTARTFLSNTIPSKVQAEEILSGFQKILNRFLEIPESYQLVIFNSYQEFNSFLADVYYCHKSYHPVHGSVGKHFVEMLKTRRFHPMQTHLKPVNPVTAPEGMPKYIVVNEPETGSCLSHEIIKKLAGNSLHNFVHADLTAVVPGVKVSLADLQSFSFGFNTSFGIPFNEIGWYISSKLFSEFILKYGGRYPADKLIKFSDQCIYYGTPDYLFLDIAKKVIEDMESRGLKNIINETVYKATHLNRAISHNPAFIHSVKDEKFRSTTTITLDYQGAFENVSDTLLKFGIVVDPLNRTSGHQRIRITNFPVHSREQFEMLSDIIESVK